LVATSINSVFQFRTALELHYRIRHLRRKRACVSATW